MLDRGTINKKVADIEVGDLIDFEGDKYADPDKDHPEFTFAFAVVQEIERETETCIVLHTSQGSFGFPIGHLIEWKEKTF